MEACINVSMVVRGPFYSVNQAGDPFVYEISHGELERDYENIPEPRKPREFYLSVHRVDGAIYFGVHDSLLDANIHGSQYTRSELIRVIEWPENVPLPDWPE
jgi:hypothetical protein